MIKKQKIVIFYILIMCFVFFFNIYFKENIGNIAELQTLLLFTFPNNIKSISLRSNLYKRLNYKQNITRGFPGGALTLKNFTVLPQNVRDLLNYNISIKKTYFYISLIGTNTDIFVLNYIKTKSIYYFFNKEKNIICGSTNNTYMSKTPLQTKNKHPINDVDETFKGITSFLFNNTIPGTPMNKLYILERNQKYINCARGDIFEYISSNIETFGDYDTKTAFNNLIVEHLYGKADLNFITEIRAALSLNQYFEFLKRESKNIKDNKLTLLHKITNKDEIQRSIDHTGQKNADLKLEYSVNQNEFNIYIDIKQKVLNAEDFTYYRVKLIYMCSGSNTSLYDSSETQKKYIQSYILNIKNSLDETDNKNLKDLYQILTENIENPALYTVMIHKINKYILTNMNKSCSQSSIILQEKVEIDDLHKENMTFISDDDAKSLTAGDLELQNLHQLKQKQLIFQKSPSGINLKERLKEQALKNSLANLKAWASPYNNNTKNDFIDDNINDI